MTAYHVQPVYILDSRGFRQCVCQQCRPLTLFEETSHAPIGSKQAQKLQKLQPQQQENPRQ